MASADGTLSPAARNAACAQVTIVAWLSTSVPSQSKTISFTVGSSPLPLREGLLPAEGGSVHPFVEGGARQLRVVQAEPAQRLLERGRRFGGQPEPATLGTGQVELAGVQHQALGGAGRVRVLAAVLAVAQDRAADQGRVRAQLVRAAGEGHQRRPGGDLAGARQYHGPGEGFAAGAVLVLFVVEVADLILAGRPRLGERQ